MLKTKRIYDPPSADDGTRVLVDRLWPRGITKDKAAINEWMKEIAPSDELRKWFGHDPDKWQEFRRRYKNELRTKTELIQKLKSESKRGTVTLLFSSKEQEHNNVAVLKEVLDR
jgi:uncharacterized protein YeaO (DUF488 family)